MQIVLLSGGSGKRLWPLSNDARSKQFIRLLPAPDGGRESMLQRVVRQLREAGIGDELTVATSVSQREAILGQIGGKVAVVTEPERRDTFPAIALSAAYLSFEKGCGDDEVVVVMPCDPFTEAGYFDAIRKMAEAVSSSPVLTLAGEKSSAKGASEYAADLVLMGIRPTYPSSKYGYIVPAHCENSQICKVSRFTEKPDVPTAEKLIAAGALWNGGVFAFRLGYVMNMVRKYLCAKSFSEVRSNYSLFPKNSFDHEVVEKAESVAVVTFDGEWKDLGTWNTLTDELKDNAIGNVIVDANAENTHVINELEIPVMCLGTRDLVIAASNDGILVSEKKRSEDIRIYADRLHREPLQSDDVQFMTKYNGDKNMLRIAVQSKGRLHDDTMILLEEAGVKVGNSRRILLEKSLSFPAEFLFLRDDDIPQYVAMGAADIGVVGENEFYEREQNADVLRKLGFGKCRLSLAVPKDVDYGGLSWFEGKRVATSYPHVLEQFFKGKGISADIHVITGSVEIVPGIGLSDAIFDIVSSGSTLVSNNLKEVEVVMDSEAVLIAGKNLPPEKQDTIGELLFRIEAVMNAQDKKYVLMNVPHEKLAAVLSVLPGAKSPTVMPLATEGWNSVHTVIEEKNLWNIIGKLKEIGAQGILVVPIEKMVY